MSTRSVIARKTDSGFKGVYHHWDGYPTALGETLFQAFNGHFKRDLDAMLGYLIDEHPAGWSTINNADFTQPPGFNEGRFRTSGPHCYCHGGREEPANPLTEKDASSCGCEWAYVFSVEDGKPMMRVLSSYCPQGSKMVGFFGCGDPDAQWYSVGLVDLTAPEPDWKAIENQEPVQPVLN